jgi:hypothetical protein
LLVDEVFLVQKLNQKQSFQGRLFLLTVIATPIFSIIFNPNFSKQDALLAKGQNAD